MILDITDKEAEILQRALELYESEPATTGLLSGMIGAMFRSGSNEEEYKRKLKADTNFPLPWQPERVLVG